MFFKLALHKIPVYSSKLAAILKIFQLNLIWSSVRQFKGGKTPNLGTFLRHFCEKWLLLGGHTPFGYFLSLRNYAKCYRHNYTSIGTIIWGDTMLHLSLKELKLDIP